MIGARQQAGPTRIASPPLSKLYAIAGNNQTGPAISKFDGGLLAPIRKPTHVAFGALYSRVAPGGAGALPFPPLAPPERGAQLPGVYPGSYPARDAPELTVVKGGCGNRNKPK